MRQLLSILSLMLLVSCGGQYDWLETNEMWETGNQDPVPTFYLDDFEYDMRTTIPNRISVNVVDKLINYCKGQLNCENGNANFLSDNVDAVCWKSYGVGQKVEILRSKWDEMSDLDEVTERASKEQVIYHELGHCVLNREHISGNKKVWGENCPSSIMNPFTFNKYKITNCYIEDHTNYITDLRR